MHKKIVFDSNGCVREADIVPQYLKEKQQFILSSYLINHGGEKVNRTELIVKKEIHGAGLDIQITKYGEKRIWQQSVELGITELQMLRDYIDSIMPEMRDFNGEKFELPTGREYKPKKKVN